MNVCGVVRIFSLCFAWLCMALALLAVAMYLRACERAQRVEVRR